MPIQYRILPDRRVAYIKAWGQITTEEILSQGMRMFSEDEWENGFAILCDYREVTGTECPSDDVEKIAEQDERQGSVFDRSKCAIVASSDLIFGLSRIWETISADTKLTKMVFREMEEATNWLGLGPDFPDRVSSKP